MLFFSQECNFIISHVFFSVSIVILYSTGVVSSIKIVILLFHLCCFVYQDYNFMFHWCCFVFQGCNFIFHWCCVVYQNCNFIFHWCCFVYIKVVILYFTGIVLLSLKNVIVLFHWCCFVYQGYNLTFHWCCFVSQECNFIISLVLFSGS